MAFAKAAFDTLWPTTRFAQSESPSPAPIRKITIWGQLLRLRTPWPATGISRSVSRGLWGRAPECPTSVAMSPKCPGHLFDTQGTLSGHLFRTIYSPCDPQPPRRKKSKNDPGLQKCRPFALKLPKLSLSKEYFGQFKAYILCSGNVRGFFASEGGSCHRGFTIVLTLFWHSRAWGSKGLKDTLSRDTLG